MQETGQLSRGDMRFETDDGLGLHLRADDGLAGEVTILVTRAHRRGAEKGRGGRGGRGGARAVGQRGGLARWRARVGRCSGAPGSSAERETTGLAGGTRGALEDGRATGFGKRAMSPEPYEP